jgi:hypothetical protein
VDILFGLSGVRGGNTGVKLGSIHSFARCMPEKNAFIDQDSSMGTSFLDYNCREGAKKTNKNILEP